MQACAGGRSYCQDHLPACLTPGAVSASPPQAARRAREQSAMQLGRMSAPCSAARCWPRVCMCKACWRQPAAKKGVLWWWQRMKPTSGNSSMPQASMAMEEARGKPYFTIPGSHRHCHCFAARLAWSGAWQGAHTRCDAAWQPQADSQAR